MKDQPVTTPGTGTNQFLKGVSTSCGVYVMRDKDGLPLYIGKAKNLRNRLRSYFRLTGLSYRIETVMQQMTEIETIVTKSETEALLLENNLIKSAKPRYNINLRDDKSYPYIRLDDSHEFPKLMFYRGNRKEPGRYFGPFSSAAAVRATLSQLQKVFPVRQCRDSFYLHRSRPCLQYQIQRCTAPCVGLVDRDSYMDDVEQVERFLMGKNRDLNNLLVSRMEHCAADRDFEQAAEYRDRIAAIQRLRESQTVEGGDSDVDVISAISAGGIICIQLVIFRSGRNIDYRNYFPKIKVEVDVGDVLSEFIPRYYLDRDVPPMILVNHRIDDKQLIEHTLLEQRGRQVEIRLPQRGRKVKLVKMAIANAEDALRRRLDDKHSLIRRYAALTEMLRLDAVPERMDCFDISHTFGEKAVASCVVFDQNGPLKSDYRSFNLHVPTAGDDYAALREALTRRYSKVRDGNGKMPDLVLIDGGKGQLGCAVDVMDELQISDIRLAAISKGKERKAGAEQVWTPESDGPVPINPTALLVLQQIRDEAHRFALLGHRSRRDKARKQSVLERIPGIGNKRRSNLLKHFGGLQGISRAGVEEIESVPGISSKLAHAIHYEIHGDQSSE
ncbi:MAG: excinuclease ABC subunit UvrC [Acidiferrobacterales bacterium]|nr:excinuclease ABC subunit UvrC [Acidiferrobacterales bacterium]